MDHKAEEAISHPKPIIVILLGGKVTDFSCNAYEFCMFFCYNWEKHPYTSILCPRQNPFYTHKKGALKMVRPSVFFVLRISIPWSEKIVVNLLETSHITHSFALELQCLVATNYGSLSWSFCCRSYVVQVEFEDTVCVTRVSLSTHLNKQILHW